MKIAYVAQFGMSAASGVLKKISAQMRAWLAAGHDVRYFGLAYDTAVWEGIRDLEIELVTGRRLRDFALRAGALVERVLAWQPDLVYLRFYLYYPALGRLVRRAPTCLEVNTHDVAEYRMNHPAYVYWWHRATRARILRRAKGIICVSHEIAVHFRRYGKPLHVIGNGIDLTSYALAAAPQNDVPRLVFLGNEQHIWQGVDEIVQFAHQIPDWHFDMIGEMNAQTRQHAPANMQLHGTLERSGYEPLLRQADAAFGGMAFYRNHMHEASQLKVREYLAYGIPVILSYRDTDFMDGAPHLLSVPNEPGGLLHARADVARFVEQWCGRRVPRTAVAHIDHQRKEAQRMAFFEELIAQHATPGEQH
jgi:glycosyltransferase involved in cell wall biosynthesis